MTQTMRSRLVLLVALVLAVGLALVACRPTFTPKIGVLLPITGVLGDLGEPMADAAELAIIQANAAGGVLGHEIEHLFQDDGTDDDQARAGAEILVEIEGVQVIIGAAGSDQSMVVLSTVTAPNQVVQISPSSTAPDFTYLDEDVGRWFFRTAPTDEIQGAVVAGMIRDDGHETASVLAVNTTYGVSFANVFAQWFENLGGTVVETVIYDEGAETFTSELGALDVEAADAVLVIGFPGEGQIILREAFELGLLDIETWYLSEGLRSAGLVDDVGVDAATGELILAGIRGTQPQAIGPALDAFVAAFEEQFGYTPEGPFDPHTYDATVLAILAIEHAGVYDGAAIRESLLAVSRAPGTEVSDLAEALSLLRNGQEINYQGAASLSDFDDIGDTVGASYEVWQVTEDGTLVSIGEITPPAAPEND